MKRGWWPLLTEPPWTFYGVGFDGDRFQILADGGVVAFEFQIAEEAFMRVRTFRQLRSLMLACLNACKEDRYGY